MRVFSQVTIVHVGVTSKQAGPGRIGWIGWRVETEPESRALGEGRKKAFNGGIG